MYGHVLLSEAVQLYQQRLTLHPHTDMFIALLSMDHLGIQLRLSCSSERLSTADKSLCLHLLNLKT